MLNLVKSFIFLYFLIQIFKTIIIIIIGYLVDLNVYLGKNNVATKNEVSIGKQAVLKLYERFFNQNRFLCADNFFSSIPLCEELWKNGIEFLGTLRANKIEIPASFLKNNSRIVESSEFAFQNHLTLSFFVPKKNKAVILVSTHHHTADIDLESNKPKMIIDYNKLKGYLCKNYIILKI